MCFVSGINKYLNMFLIEEKMYDESKCKIPSKNIWEYLDRRWKIKEAVNN